MKKKIISLLLLATLSVAEAAAQGVGTWKAYMAYSDIEWIERGGSMLYVLASDNLYTYNEKDKSLQTYDKVTGLNDCDIDYIGWNAAARRLVVVYADYNIDLLDEKGNVASLPDYYHKSITADKRINDLAMSGSYCYVSTGFGVMKINVAQGYISDTYNLGFNVDYTYTEGSYVFAASKERGLYRGLTTDNLLDKKNWERIGDYTARTKKMDEELVALAKTLSPGGPRYNNFAFMRFSNNRLYTVGGLFKSGSVSMNNPGMVQVLQDGEWTIYQDNLSTITGYSYTDNNCLAVDPGNPDHLFVGGKTGLYEFLKGQLKNYYNKDNSLLHGAMDRGQELGNSYVLINGLTYDSNGSLWILNSQSNAETILELSPDGKMTSHHKSAMLTGGVGPSVLSNAMFDSRGLMWFVNDNWEPAALYCYQPSTDGLNIFNRFVNQDGTTVAATRVHCVAEDASQNIWVGTDVGPIVLEPSQLDNAEETVFTQVKVPRNDGTNLADYLLSGVDITCMAIDGGGRKWFGTSSSGVYLISADNMTQVQHFQTSNSKLLSDNVMSIAIDDASGEVFFGTDKGLCSYVSDATKPIEKMDKDVTYAYPNPVKPGYTGPITIVGLTLNASVKILTTNGILVAEGTSNGGSFVWDGNDRNGKRVASGVYMVATADENGDNGTVCKIAVIN